MNLYECNKKLNRFKEIHLYIKFDLKYWDDEIPITVDFYEAMLLFQNPNLRNNDILHTTQTHFLRFSYGEKLFVHTLDGEVHVITLGDCEGTNREIKEGHNIEKMLLQGEFDWF